MKKILLIIALSLSQLSHSQEVSGLVVGVADGDTLYLLDKNKTNYKVRLANIDAPEKSQAFGKRSKQRLSNLCYKKNATISYTKNDRYGRVIAVVTCNGINANLDQVKTGMAWVYKKYCDDPVYYSAQRKAFIEGTGLWRDEHPTPPWDYRRKVPVI